MNLGLNKLCDISTLYFDDNYRDSYDVELLYSIKTGHWWGDDSLSSTSWSSDDSGYGRLNGCDDGSIYNNDRDCELCGMPDRHPVHGADELDVDPDVVEDLENPEDPGP